MSDRATLITPHSRITIERDVHSHTAPNTAIDVIRCTLFGDLCVQSFTAFFVWEKVFAATQYQVARFIELGAGFGGTSLYFLLMCTQCSAAYYGYERFKKRRNAHRNSQLKQMMQLEDHIRYEDIFKEPTHSDLKSLIATPGCTILFCDGSDKVHEFRQFAPVLKVGDIIAAHDWPRAIRTEWVAEVIEGCGLRQIMMDDCAQLETHTAWFRKEI